MPLHEFKCSSCDYEFELLIMNKSELEEVRCPKCQSPEVGKLMSATNYQVGGGGAKRGGETSSPKIQQHSCGSGSCTNIELPGHQK